jgi:hypothetical protein
MSNISKNVMLNPECHSELGSESLQGRLVSASNKINSYEILK